MMAIVKCRIEQLWIPDSVDAPDAPDFLAAVEVGRSSGCRRGAATTSLTRRWRSSSNWTHPYERQVILEPKIEGTIVGAVDIALPLTDNLDLAEFTLDILPEYQRQGVGRQLLEAAEQFARDEGRSMILWDTNHPGASLHEFEPEQLVPGSGKGFVPLGSREVEFARQHRLHAPAHRAVQLMRRCRWTASSWRNSKPRRRKRTTAATACTTGRTAAPNGGWRPLPSSTNWPGDVEPDAVGRRGQHGVRRRDTA